MSDKELNEIIALRFGWKREGDFHKDKEEWEGWRDPEGNGGYSGTPNFIAILECLLPGVGKLFNCYEKK